MKRIYATLFLASIALVTVAQNTVPRVPVYEILSSSTCPPCKPANDHLAPIFEDYEGQLAIVKYQMSWPGTGDPYYTSEAQHRRTFYGVNGVPSIWLNAENVSYSSVSSGTVDADLAEETSMAMELRYMINADSQSIRIRARVEALEDYNDGGHRLYIPIVEHTTYNNKKTNGENEFHNVLKKMLPEQYGELIIGAVEKGTVLEYDTTYVFQGDYRLPNNASDQIDHEIEHSVEEFEDLHVVMFMQSLIDESIYQGAVGELSTSEDNLEREWGTDPLPPLSLEEFNADKTFALYPNPAKQSIFLEFAEEVDIELITVYSVKGERVLDQVPVKQSRYSLDISSLNAGMYVLEVLTNGEVEQRSFIVE